MWTNTNIKIIKIQSDIGVKKKPKHNVARIVRQNGIACTILRCEVEAKLKVLMQQ